MKLLNIEEDIPEIFYIFVGLGKSIASQVNYHNYKLTKTIFSGGFKNLMIHYCKIKDFINGDIVYAPFVPNETTFKLPTSHLMGVINGYQTEYILEYTRANNYQKYPSRFSCIYAFGDYESCVKAYKLYPKMFDLKKLKKFKLKKTNTDLDKCIKIVKCNMEIITRMWNCDIISFEHESVDRIANAYWQGLGQVAIERQDIETGLYNQVVSDVLYEYLIEGILEEIE